VALFFAVTLFVSAFLLFLVQPMVGKMVLPLLGGAPAAWATCMVFFQALLLAGYAYAHAAIRRLGSRRQAVIHLAVLALPLLVLGSTALLTGAPIRAYKSLAPQGQELPFFGAIALLAAAIGLPFFVVATSAPLLQRWFAETDHPAARDPYFLYAASNLGSLLALVCYPFLVEPRYTLATQGWLWSAGYLLLVGLTICCAWQLRRSPATSEREPDAPTRKNGFASTSGSIANPIFGWGSRLRWLALAFVPSSLLLSVTQFITTDIAPVPGLWVLPLAVYLLTFVVAFGRTPRWVQQLVEIVAPVAVLILLFVILTDRKSESLGLILAMHMTVFFLVALNCHIDLARHRPGAERLTEFYLWVSLGGVLGGLFNSLIAPLLFNDLFEYPLVLVAACLLQPAAGQGHGPRSQLLDMLVPLAVAGLTLALYCVPADRLWPVVSLPLPSTARPFYRWANFFTVTVWKYVAYGVPLLACYWWIERPVRFGLCVAAVWLVLTAGAELDSRQDHRLLHKGRSFFGVLAVQNDVDRAPEGEIVTLPDGTAPIFHRLVHGTTLHGLQCWDPPSDEPLTYYHRTGPIGQVFAAKPPGVMHGRFAFVGLGSGSLAAYGQSGQSITFYEIDPAVRRVAEDPQYFSYLSGCKATYHVEMGDARLKLEERAQPGEYGLIVVDAFSSDAIPIHLLTKEALELYFDKLADDGIIALHLSNRYLNLEVVVARLARELRAREPNLAALRQWDMNDRFDPPEDASAANHIPGKRPSQWVVLAKNAKHLAALHSLPMTMAIDGRAVTLAPWKDLSEVAPGPLWTDDFSNLTQILNWEYILPWKVDAKPAASGGGE
jgi:hypothetical protein